MVSDMFKRFFNWVKVVVLILVLMEYGLWRIMNKVELVKAFVLILVLMEYGLWRMKSPNFRAIIRVLILVLMEYGLWPVRRWLTASKRLSLNPCSNGIWSLTDERRLPVRCVKVLILVLMEYGLWQYPSLHHLFDRQVLILVLMEYGLWQLTSE